MSGQPSKNAYLEPYKPGQASQTERPERRPARRALVSRTDTEPKPVLELTSFAKPGSQASKTW